MNVLPDPARALRASLLACLGAVATTSGALAQTVPIDEVIVTATRRAADPDTLSQAVSRINPDERTTASLSTDLLKDTPGLFLQQTTPGQGAVIVRGQRGSAVLHLVDGIRLNNALFRTAPTPYAALVPVTALERVEMLRGTPAALYGTDAIGGAVQLITRRPSRDSDQLSAGGRVSLVADSASLTQRLTASVDVGTRTLAATASAEYQHTGDRRIGGGERISPSGYRARGGRIAVAGQPEAGPEWLLDMHYMEQPSTPRIDELVAGFGQDAPSSAEFRFAPSRRRYVHAQVRQADGALGLDWRADLAWQRIDDDRLSRATDSGIRRFEQNASDLYSAVATAGRTLANGDWLVGLEHHDDRVSSARQTLDVNSGATSEVASRFPDGSRVRQSSLFVHATHGTGAGLRLNGGLRVTASDIKLAATATTAAETLDLTDVGGDVGALLQLGERWQLAANLGIGFRDPNIADLGTLGERPGNRFNIPNAALDSEQARQGDLSLRFGDDNLRASLTVFSLQYDDRITSVSTGAVTPDGRTVVQSVNADESDVWGIELGANWQPGRDLRVDAVVNMTRGDTRTPDGADQPGDRIPPTHGLVALSYTGTRFEWGGRIDFATRQDRLSDRDLQDPRIDPEGTPGWVIVGLSAAWSGPDEWQVRVALDNLLDQRYRRHGSGIDAPGRNLSLGIVRTF